MKSHLARHFSTVRRRKGIRLGQLARMVGYQNVGKGANRIDKFEKWSLIHEDLLTKLAIALGIDGKTVARLIEYDRQRYLREWEQWANTPIRPSLILGHVGGFCRAEPLPEQMTREAAEQHAAGVAKNMDRPISLILSRRLSIQFDRNGNRTSVHEAKPGDINVPYQRFGGRKVSFDLGSGKMEVMNEPPKEQVVTDFGGVQLRSTFEVVQEEPGQVTINVEGPVFGPSDEEANGPDISVGIDMVLESRDVFLDDAGIKELFTRLDLDVIQEIVSRHPEVVKQISIMLGEIEDQLLRLGVITGPKHYQ